MMTSIETYQELHRNATTDNQVTSALRTLEYQSTLSEITELAAWLGQQDPKRRWREAEQFWLDKFHEKLPRVEENHRNDWVSVWHRGQFHRYSSKTSEKKILLVCFADQYGWMLLPSWVFLAHLPEEITDVIIAQSKQGLHQSNFVRYRDVWQEVFTVVDEICKQEDYQEIYTLGTSGGCVAATLFSASYRVSGVTLVGSPSLSDNNLKLLSEESAAILKSRSSIENVQATFIFGLRNRLAISQLPRFIRLFPRRRIRFFLKSQHNVFGSMFRRGELSAVLKWLT